MPEPSSQLSFRGVHLAGVVELRGLDQHALRRTGTSRASVRVPASTGSPSGSVANRLHDVLERMIAEKSDRHQPPSSYVAGIDREHRRRQGERCPSEIVGSVRITAVAVLGHVADGGQDLFGGDSPARSSRRPTSVCAASSWLRRTIARYDVETTSSPIASSSSSAAANPVPGRSARACDPPGRSGTRRVRPIRRSIRGSTNSSRRRARNEMPNSSSVGASQDQRIDRAPPGRRPRSRRGAGGNAKIPSGRTNSSTGTRDSNGRSSREAARRSSSTVRVT